MPTTLDYRIVISNRIHFEGRSPAVGKNQNWLPMWTWLITYSSLLAEWERYLKFACQHHQLVHSMPHLPVTVESLCAYPHSQKGHTLWPQNWRPINCTLIVSRNMECLNNNSLIAHLLIGGSLTLDSINLFVRNLALLARLATRTL